VQDSFWSALALKQIIGRAHRFPQENVVHVFLLCALRSIDVLMLGHAAGKDEALQGFCRQAIAQAKDDPHMAKLLGRIGLPKTIGGSKTKALPSAKGGGKQGHNRASVEVVITPTKGEQIRLNSAPKPGKKTSRNAKSRAVIDDSDDDTQSEGDAAEAQLPRSKEMDLDDAPKRAKNTPHPAKSRAVIDDSDDDTQSEGDAAEAQLPSALDGDKPQNMEVDPQISLNEDERMDVDQDVAHADPGPPLQAEQPLPARVLFMSGQTATSDSVLERYSELAGVPTGEAPTLPAEITPANAWRVWRFVHDHVAADHAKGALSPAVLEEMSKTLFPEPGRAFSALMDETDDFFETLSRKQYNKLMFWVWFQDALGE
jgi:hypothetical protein